MHYLVYTFVFLLSISTQGLSFHGKSWEIEKTVFRAENQSYAILMRGDDENPGQLLVQRKGDQVVSRTILGRFTIFYSTDDPVFGFGKRATGGSPVANWGEAMEADIWNQTKQIDVSAIEIVEEGNAIRWKYEENELFSFSAALSLPEGESEPIISWNIVSKADGYFAVAFTGLAESDSEKLDFLYQPLIWSWKRFPDQAVVTPESYVTTPSVFTAKEGITEGLSIPSVEIPYRFATATNSRFGLILRTNTGAAKPMVMAPLYGGQGSYLKKGETHRFSVQYFLNAGTWIEGVDYLYKNVMDYPLERQNAMVSLNDTFQNMIDFAMDDYYSGWVSEYKGYDYKFDVPNTVKNVSALHPLSIALTTDNRQIYDRRALPMLEYLMSREKYLYAINAFPEKQNQNPSHFLNGPAMELWEMASIHQLLGRSNSALPKEMERLFGKSRQLNLQTEVSGASWKDYLARYLVDEGQEYLDSAIRLADAYLELTFYQYPTDYSTNAGLRDSQATFVNDYSTTWQELLELYELTKDEKYLDAAYEGAKQLSLWTRSTPFAPKKTITVNEGGKVEGVFPGRRFKSDSYEWQEFDMTTQIQEQVVPAWHTSLVGLLPEQPGTYVYGPIMLFHQAGALLRIAHLKKDEILQKIAYNGILGRYANFPGYYFTSLYTNVYQQINYPLHPYLEINYNAVFYNHIWPHIALIQDFLVSDAYFRSDGNVDFPGLFSPGYAFLSNKVYGHAPGTIYGHENVNLWLPKNPFKTKDIGFNYVLGRDGSNTYIVLMNTTSRLISDTLHLSQEVFKWDHYKDYRYNIVNEPDYQAKNLFSEGMLPIQLAPHGLKVIKISCLNQKPSFPPVTTAATVSSIPGYYRNEFGQAALGTITGMSLKANDEFKDIFLYSSSLENEVNRVQLHYQVGDGDWVEETDRMYPFEFSIRVRDATLPVRWKWKATDHEGNNHETELVKIY